MKVVRRHDLWVFDCPVCEEHDVRHGGLSQEQVERMARQHVCHRCTYCRQPTSQRALGMWLCHRCKKLALMGRLFRG